MTSGRSGAKLLHDTSSRMMFSVGPSGVAVAPKPATCTPVNRPCRPPVCSCSSRTSRSTPESAGVGSASTRIPRSRARRSISSSRAVLPLPRGPQKSRSSEGDRPASIRSRRSSAAASSESRPASSGGRTPLPGWNGFMVAIHPPEQHSQADARRDAAVRSRGRGRSPGPGTRPAARPECQPRRKR